MKVDNVVPCPLFPVLLLSIQCWKNCARGNAGAMNNILLEGGGKIFREMGNLGGVAFDIDFAYFIFFQGCTHAR